MKRIFLLTAATLLLGGPVVAGDLKIAVPVDDFKQLKSRLEALEKENSQLKEQAAVAKPAAVAVAPVDPELKGRLQAVESENSRLRQELNAAKVQERPAPVNTDAQARLEAVEKENRLLKEAQARQSEKGVGGADADLTAKLNVAENENIKLQQEVKTLKEGGLAAVFAENKISARELYFLKRSKGLGHAYKF